MHGGQIEIVSEVDEEYNGQLVLPARKDAHQLTLPVCNPFLTPG